MKLTAATLQFKMLVEQTLRQGKVQERKNTLSGKNMLTTSVCIDSSMFPVAANHTGRQLNLLFWWWKTMQRLHWFSSVCFTSALSIGEQVNTTWRKKRWESSANQRPGCFFPWEQRSLESCLYLVSSQKSQKSSLLTVVTMLPHARTIFLLVLGVTGTYPFFCHQAPIHSSLRSFSSPDVEVWLESLKTC